MKYSASLLHCYDQASNQLARNVELRLHGCKLLAKVSCEYLWLIYTLHSDLWLVDTIPYSSLIGWHNTILISDWLTRLSQFKKVRVRDSQMWQHSQRGELQPRPRWSRHPCWTLPSATVWWRNTRPPSLWGSSWESSSSAGSHSSLPTSSVDSARWKKKHFY